MVATLALCRLNNTGYYLFEYCVAFDDNTYESLCYHYLGGLYEDDERDLKDLEVEW